jgi:glycosyltransferase involved in cell wall biosynthesis
MSDQAKPLVSILLPVYNGEKYLAGAIENILAQSYENFELLIADDCSSDGSRQIIEAYAARDKRIVSWVNDKNLKLFPNYNKCLERATGKYVKPFAQDDLLHTDAIARMVQVLENKPEVALVVVSKNWIDEHAQEIEKLTRFKSDAQLKARDVITANLVVLNNWVGEPSTVMFRREHAGNGFDTAFYHWGDLDYWFRILQNGDMFVLADILCSFRLHKQSSTSATLSGIYFPADIVKMYKRWHRYLDELGESEEHFYKRVSEVNARHLDHIVRVEAGSAEKAVEAMRTANPTRQESFSFDEVADFREALFHAERRITSLMEELVFTKNELEHRENECRELHEAIGVMRNSVSWKLTSPLRSVRSKF